MANRVLKPTCEVDRHDNDHVEVKLGFHDPRDYDVDIYFFAPPTLGLTYNNPKVEFLNSMRSYVRLQTSPSGLQTSDHISAERVFLEAQRLHDILQKETLDVSSIVNAVKNTAVVYESYLKGRGKGHTKVQKSCDLESLQEEITQTLKLNTTLRHALRQALSSKRAWPLPVGSRPALTRLGDYVSYLMVDYLSCLQQRLKSIEISNGKDKKLLEDITTDLEGLAQEELALRKKIGLHIESNAAPAVYEEYLYKTALLKKYFQRVLFIQVKSTPVAKKVLQPIAAIAAGLAGLWATLFDQARYSSSIFKQWGLTPTWILTIVVVAYIIRDRVKDVGRVFLEGRVQKVLPDVQKNLTYEGDAMGSRVIGKIKEFVRCVSSQELPAHIYDARYAHSTSSLEAELGEDIIHYNKKILLDKSSKNVQWGLREVLRFSLSHYFQNLDDPFKEISFIDDTGKLRRHEAHKVYFAHLVFQVSYKEDGKLVKDVKTAKLVLDKQGLVKVSQPELISEFVNAEPI